MELPTRFVLQITEAFQTRLRILAAILVRVVDGNTLQKEGDRKRRVPVAPAAACAVVESTRVSHHGRTGIIRRFLRNGFTAYSALSPVTGLSCHRRPQEALLLENLTPASGRQDHTTSPSAKQRSRQQRYQRPSHPRPTFVTIAKRPCRVGRDGERYAGDLGPKGTGIFLQRGLDDPNHFGIFG